MKLVKYIKSGFFLFKKGGFELLFSKIVTKAITTDFTYGFALRAKYLPELDAHPSHYAFGEDKKREAVVFNTSKTRQRRNYSGDIKIAWFLPDFEAPGGGHTNIFRCQKYLKEDFGIESVNVMYPGVFSKTHPKLLAKKYEEKATRIFSVDYSGTPFLQSAEELKACQVLMATTWASVYGVVSRAEGLLRTYFVQDYEPTFYGLGGKHLYAQKSYEFGLAPICAGQWLAQKLQLKEKNIDHVAYNLSADYSLYRPNPSVSKRAGVCFYIRTTTDRRGYELAIGTMLQLKAMRPDIELYTLGMDSGPIAWMDFAHHYGALGVKQLADVYSKHQVFVVFSFTNYSLIPAEAIACGCPVVDLKMENNEAVKNYFPAEYYKLADPSADEVAKSVLNLYDNPPINQETIAEWKSSRGSWKEEYSKIGNFIFEQFGR